LAAFRQAHDWLAAANGDSPRWTWTLQSFQSLGHLELDWQTRRWEVAPSTIATIVGGGGYALLCGARPRWFLRRLDCLDSDPTLSYLADSIVLERPVPQNHGPSLRLVTLDEEKDAAEVCKGLGVAYSPFAADHLLHLLPNLTQFLRVGHRAERSLPGGVLPTRMGYGEAGQPLFGEMSDPNEITPGAYCMALFDTRRYFYVHCPGEIFEAGRGEVIYAELRRRGSHVLTGRCLFQAGSVSRSFTSGLWYLGPGCCPVPSPTRPVPHRVWSCVTATSIYSSLSFSASSSDRKW
jgi:hypothetical protein